MAGTKVVLVTGVSNYWGARLAARLSAEVSLEVVGLDAAAPAGEIDGLEFVRADIRSPQLSDLFQARGVDVVCHLKFQEHADGRSAERAANVTGAANVLSACAESGVERLVLRSSTAVYGARPDNSAFLTEETPLRGGRSGAATSDLHEIEALCERFREQSPQTTVSLLRFANIVGPTADTPLTRFLGLPVPMILLGFDPVMQLVHEDDVVEALAYVVMNDMSGTFNVAAEGAMPLSRLLRLARKIALPVFHPLAYKGFGLIGAAARRQARRVTIEWDYLRYPWLGDLARMREEMGFLPGYDAVEALAYLRPAAADVAVDEEEKPE